MKMVRRGVLGGILAGLCMAIACLATAVSPPFQTAVTARDVFGHSPAPISEAGWESVGVSATLPALGECRLALRITDVQVLAEPKLPVQFARLSFRDEYAWFDRSGSRVSQVFSRRQLTQHLERLERIASRSRPPRTA